MEKAGKLDEEFELISIDEGWLKNTSDAIAAQMRDAGLKVKRTLYPGATFWNDWTGYPFSTTPWGALPLGVQAYRLAYYSGQPWNESGHSNPEFDKLLDEATTIFDADLRREKMEKLQNSLRDSGVIIQPYWTNRILHQSPKLKGYGAHVQREMHLDRVWLES